MCFSVIVPWGIAYSFEEVWNSHPLQMVDCVAAMNNIMVIVRQDVTGMTTLLSLFPWVLERDLSDSWTI